jgi:hypothetical protein
MVIKKRKFLGLSTNFIDEWWGVEIGNKEPEGDRPGGTFVAAVDHLGMN